MIVTLTPNPSLDRTIELGAPLERGAVQRAVTARQEPGGKGVNISRALVASGAPTLALLPGDADDGVVLALGATHIPCKTVSIGASLRSNVTITDPDGTTTKVNEPGPVLTDAQQNELLDLAVTSSQGAAWLVLAGSLPPGVEADFYARVIAALHAKYGVAAPKVAVDSSSLPLAKSIVAGLDLIKPNGEELAELLGLDDVEALEASPEATADAAQQLVDRGVGAVLATMGAKGAVLVTREGRWFAQAPKIEARSTVGAGDCSLAGYLLSDTNGGSSPAALRQAVAHGSAAASLPGTTVPALSETFPEAVTVTDLARAKEF